MALFTSLLLHHSTRHYQATLRFEPTHGGFAEPSSGDSDPCSPFAGFRIRVSVFRAAWRLRAIRPSGGPAFPVGCSVREGGQGARDWVEAFSQGLAGS